MINLSKERVVIYTYFFIVLTLIFGLSFTVEGDKISGAAIAETTSKLISNISSINFIFILFAFFFILAFALYIIRFSQAKKELHPSRINTILSIVIILLIVAFVSFGVYFGKSEEKVTGYVTATTLTELSEDDNVLKTIDNLVGPNYVITKDYSVLEFDAQGILSEIPKEKRTKILIDNDIAEPVRPKSVSFDQFGTYGNQQFVEIRGSLYEYKDGVIGDKVDTTTLVDFGSLSQDDYMQLLSDSGIGKEATLPDGSKRFVDTSSRAVFKSNGQLETDYKNINKAWVETGVATVVPYGGLSYLYHFDATQKKYIYRPYNEKTGDFTGSKVDENQEIFRFLEATKENIIRKDIEKQIINTLAYEATWQLLNLALGSFAYGAVSDYCAEQYDSSVPLGSAGSGNTNSGPPGETEEETPNCLANETTVTAQATKLLTGPQFEYDTSYTVTACNVSVQYSVLLESDLLESTNIATGITNFGDISSEAISLTHTISFNQICVDVTDTSIGDNGKACFEIVDLTS